MLFSVERISYRQEGYDHRPSSSSDTARKLEVCHCGALGDLVVFETSRQIVVSTTEFKIRLEE
jgi:hypothetical protein